MERSHCSDNKSGLKKGAWTPEEDRKLTAYITRYGSWNWRQLPKFAGLSRCGKSCRLRWLNYLRPNIKRGNYSKDEEDTIIRLHQSLGNRWSAIAAQLPGRTDNEIKNHWHTNLKKRANVKLNLNRKQKKSQETDEHPTPTAASQTMSLEMEQPQVEELHSNLDATVDNDHHDELIISNNTANAENFSSIFGELEFPGVDDHQYDFDLLGEYNNNNNNNIIVAPSTWSSGDFWTEPFLCDNYCYNMAGDHQDELLIDQYSDSAILDHEDTTGAFCFSSGLLHDDSLLNYCTTI